MSQPSGYYLLHWATTLQHRLTAGEPLDAILEDYSEQAARDRQAAKFRSLTQDQAKLLKAFYSGDWDTLEASGWVNGHVLTSPATRMLLDAWDIQDQASS